MKGPQSHALVIYPPLNNKCMGMSVFGQCKTPQVVPGIHTYIQKQEKT